MTLWLFGIAIVLVVGLGLRSARRQREAWLRSLNLVGKWELDAPPGNADDDGAPRQRRSITLSGELDGGTYVARDAEAVQRGNWRLRGRSLSLAPTEGEGAISTPANYDIRLFDKGKIGLDGPGRTREVYAKRDSNVIPLRVRK